jgi:uncharacterized membrane protein
VTAAALALALAAAFAHAGWNFLAKRVAGGVAFVFLIDLVSTVIYLPLAVADALIERPHVGVAAIVFVVGSGVIHGAYFLLLQRGYRVGDLSVVYPIARGGGLLIASGAAVVILGERPGPFGIAGVLLVAGGIASLSRPLRGVHARPALAYAAATAAMIGAYTVWDKHAVSALALPPLLFNWTMDIVRGLLMAPVVWPRRAEVVAHWPGAARDDWDRRAEPACVRPRPRGPVVRAGQPRRAGAGDEHPDRRAPRRAAARRGLEAPPSRLGRRDRRRSVRARGPLAESPTQVVNA